LFDFQVIAGNFAATIKIRAAASVGSLRDCRSLFSPQLGLIRITEQDGDREVMLDSSQRINSPPIRANDRFTLGIERSSRNHVGREARSEQTGAATLAGVCTFSEKVS